AVALARGDDVVLGARLLEHQPLRFDVVPRMSPVAPRVQVADVEAVLHTQGDARKRPRGLARDEGFPADRRLVVEEDAVAREHAVGLAVVHRDPVGVELGHAIGRARIERRRLLLRRLGDLAVELGGRRLVIARLHAEDAQRLEEPERAQPVGVRRVLGLLEGHRDMALRAEVIDLVGLRVLQHPHQARAVGQVAVVQDEPAVVHVRVLVQVVDALGVEERGAPLDAMDDVTLLQQKLGEIGAVLAGDAGDQGDFRLLHGGRIRIVSADSTAHFHSTHLNAPQSALSAVLITRNAADVLEPCLESLRFADEIVVVDSGSSDGTADVAARHGARVVPKEWLGFGRQKQFAVEQARNDWVLCLDADERVSAELAASINAALAAPVSPVYRMARRNRFLGRWLAHGEGYPDWSPRLFNRMNARWSDDLVHEKVLFAVTPGTLQGDLMHDSSDDLTGYLERQNRYTTLAARQAFERGVSAGAAHLLLSPVVRFFKFYVLRLGFLDGVPGLLHISIGCMNSYMKYAKLIELRKAEQE